MKIIIHIKHPQVSAWTFSVDQANKLRQKLPGHEVVVCANAEEFEQQLQTAEVAVGWYFKQEWVDGAANLRVLATPAAGRDYFSVKLPEGVQTINGTFHGVIMAETALAMILAHSRRIIDASVSMRTPTAADNGWGRAEYDARARCISGANLLILGFGRIGKRAGRLARALGMNIIGINRSDMQRPDYFTENDRVCPISELERYLPVADHILLILPSGETSDNILNASRFELLRDDVGIYNIGRGNAIDEDALIGFLQKNPAAGAYLDVFRTEPLPEGSPLRRVANAHLLPHASAIAPEYLDLFVDDFCQQLAGLGLG